MDNFIGINFFILGLLLGSFANVIIYRLPKGESVVRPRSHCFNCKKTVVWYDNIPVLSWLVLRGKCRHCRSSFSIRYPIVELIMGLLFAGLYLKFGLSYFLLEYCIFVFALVTASFIDLDHMILPDVFTLSGIVIGLVGAALNPDREWLSAFYGVLLGGGSLWAVAVVYSTLRKQDGMGGGDIKLLAWIGAVLGWTSVPFVILSSSLVGSLAGLIMMIRARGNLSLAIPFGPYLALGAVLYIFLGQEIAQLYIEFFIPSLSPVN